jgi:hypothetical protein
MKCVFTIYGRGDKLKRTVEKVCDGFAAKRYDCPDDIIQINEKIYSISRQTSELQEVSKA